jgi:hypothetical protein
MKNSFVRFFAFFLVIACLAGLLPACESIQPSGAANSYVAILPSVLHSGKAEAISLSLFKATLWLKIQ